LKKTERQFQETDKKFKETDEKFKETDKKFQETEKLIKELAVQNKESFKEIHGELGGIGKSNDQVAEDYFYSSIKSNYKVGKMEFDYIDRNRKRET